MFADFVKGDSGSMLFQTTVVPVAPLVLWFLLFGVKHVVADYVLQPAWMAMGKERATGWLRPLLAHCLIHGALTTGLLLILRPHLWVLGLVDFAVHVTIDRIKGMILVRYALGFETKAFWTVLGIDQTLHHLTGFALALVIAAN